VRRFLLTMTVGVLALGGVVVLAMPASAHEEHRPRAHFRHEFVHREFHKDARWRSGWRHESHYRHAAHRARRAWHRR
jgi:hypothetical protein